MSAPVRPLPFEYPAIIELTRRECVAERRAEVLLQVRRHIREHGFLPTGAGHHLMTIEAIARIMDKPLLDRSEAALNAYDAGESADKGAFDAAVDYSTVMMSAAMVFGYTVGMALAQNDDGGVR